MTKDQFLRKLETELGLAPGLLTEDRRLATISAWDSMGRMAVLAMIDTELGTALPAGTLQRCQTVGDLLALVSQKLAP